MRNGNIRIWGAAVPDAIPDLSPKLIENMSKRNTQF